MVQVALTDEHVVFEVQASHKLWAVKSRVEVPLEHITGAHVDPHPAMGWFDGLKVIGTDVPNVFRAGTFWLHGDLAFYDVRHPEQTIVVDLAHEHFKKLIVEVEDPEATVQMIRQAIANRGSATR